MTYDYNEWLKNPIKIFCKCGCGKEIIVKKRPYKYTGIPEHLQGHVWKNRHHTEETKSKMRGKNNPMFGRNQSGNNNPMFGKKHTEETKQKIRDALSGEKSPMFGKHPSIETRKKQSKSRKGKQCGNKNPNWNGGKSFEPYCYKFNKLIKENIRNRDDYQCQMPGCLCNQLENLIRYNGSLNVHHIHYDKSNCNPDLITLCNVCNGIVNYNRNYWEELFMKILRERNLC